MLFAFFPLFLLFVDGAGATILALLIVCLLIPGLYLIYLLLGLTDEGAKARRSLEPGALRSQLQPKNLSGAEDPIRESDGYFRLCAPHYVKVEPTQSEPKVGAKGVLTWVGGAEDTTVTQDISEYLLFRNMGVDDALAFDLPDQVTQRVRTALADAIPDFDPDRRHELLGELSSPWNVRYMSSSSSLLIAKMPWEHHELLVMPVQWAGAVTYPHGTGLHDANGLPCGVDSMDIRIDIAPEIVEAVKNSAGADLQSKQRVAELQANYRRVLPAVYEAIYGLLIRELRKFSLPLLFEHGEGVEELGQRSMRNLQEAVSHGLADALPKPIGSLVKVSIANMSQPDTVILSEKQRAAVTNYRAIEATMATTQYKKLQELEHKARKTLYDVQAHLMHAERLRRLRREVLTATNDCQNSLNHFLSKAKDKLDPSAASGAIAAIREGHGQLLDSCGQTLDEMTEALDSIEAAFSDRPTNASAP